MAGIFSHVDDDISNLRRLKNEIKSVKDLLLGINIKVDLDIKTGLESQLKSLTSEYETLAQKVAETEGKIASSVVKINQATERIVSAQSEVLGRTSNSSAGVSGSGETANIQSQAKAYEELESEIAKILGTREQNISKIIEEQHAIDMLKQQIKSLNNDWIETGQISDSDRALLEQYNTKLLEHKTTLSGVQQVVKNEEKLNQATSGSMKKLALQLERMRILYRQLDDDKKKSPFGKELISSIDLADQKIKGLDATIGNYQRNVGNYTQRWNGLNMSIQQLAREMPSLAYGPQIFFSAISNNLPIFADELKRAKEEYNAFKAAGQKATPVWKQILTSLVSWQTALTVGITLLTVYGKEIWEWAKGLFSANSELDKMRENLSSISAEMESSIKSEMAVVDNMFNALKKAEKGSNDYKIAKDAIIEQYGKYLKGLTDEKNNILNLEAAYLRVADAIKKKAEATALEKVTNKASEKYETEFDEQTQIIMYALKKRFDKNDIGSAIVDNFYQMIMNDIARIGGISKETKLSLKKSLGVASNKGNTSETYTDIINAVSAIREARTIFDKEFSEAQKRLSTANNEYANYAKDELILRKNAIKEALEYADVESEIVAATNTGIVMSFKDRVEAELALQKIESAIYESGKRVAKPKSAKELKLEEAENKRIAQEAKAENKLNKIREGNKRKRLKSEQETANELEQLQIDLEQNATKKKLRQINLDYKLELQAIKNWEEKIKQAKIESARSEFEADPKNKGKVFDSSTVDTTLSTDESALLRQKEKSNLITYFTEINNIHRESYEKNKQIREEYIRNYGSYLEQLNLLQQQHSQRISSLSTPEEIKLENANYEQSLEELKSKFGLVTNSMADLFEDASEKSATSIQEIIDKYESLVEVLSAKSGKPISKDDLAGTGLSEKQIQDVVSGKISIKDIADAIKELKGELKGKSPWQAFVNDISDAVKKLKEAKGNTERVGEGVTNIGDAIVAFTPALQSFSSSLASIFGYGDSDIQDIIGAVGGLGQAASGVGQMISGDIIGGAMSAVSGIGSFVSSFKALADRDNERRIQRLQEQIEALDKSYGELGKSVENAYSYDAKGLIEDQNKLLEQQKVLIRQQIKEEEDKKDTDEERIKEWEAQIEEINEIIEDNKQKAIDAIFGEDVASAIDRLSSAYADAVASGKPAWKSAKDYVKETVKNMVTESVKSALSASKAIENIRTKLRDFLADGILTMTEENIVNQMAEQAMNNLEAQFGWANKYFKDGDTEQEASSKGLDSLSQETGKELNGRFTALQLAGEAVKEQSEEQTKQLSLLTATASELRGIGNGMQNSLAGISDQIALAYLELQEINDNTSKTVKCLKEIKTDIAEVRKNTSRL